MYIIERIKKLDPYFGQVGLSIGNFEGFHRGHIRIIGCLMRESKRKKLYSAVITFKQHPLKILSGKEPERLWAPFDKIESFKDTGIDLLMYIDFSKEFSANTVHDFLTDLKLKLAPKLLCLGSNFRFGKDNSGDIEILEKLSHRYQFTLNPVEEVMLDGLPVSSTRIRAAVKAGNMKLAERMLGRRYSVHISKDSSDLSLKPFIPNVALPQRGMFSGIIEELHTKKGRNESFKIENRYFQPISNGKFINGVLYKFHFDAKDSNEKIIL